MFTRKQNWIWIKNQTETGWNEWCTLVEFVDKTPTSSPKKNQSDYERSVFNLDSSKHYRQFGVSSFFRSKVKNDVHSNWLKNAFYSAVFNQDWFWFRCGLKCVRMILIASAVVLLLCDLCVYMIIISGKLRQTTTEGKKIQKKKIIWKRTVTMQLSCNFRI